MVDNRVKCKAWMYCKDVKISRIIVWRSKIVGKENVGKSSMFDLSVRISIVVEESVRFFFRVFDELTFANEIGF